MICTKCHKGSPRIYDQMTFVEGWRIRAKFIADHISHNRAWGRRWANSFLNAVKNGGPSQKPEEREALEALWKEFQHRLA